jgi:hypothetical protein
MQISSRYVCAQEYCFFNIPCLTTPRSLQHLACLSVTAMGSRPWKRHILCRRLQFTSLSFLNTNFALLMNSYNYSDVLTSVPSNSQERPRLNNSFDHYFLFCIFQ